MVISQNYNLVHLDLLNNSYQYVLLLKLDRINESEMGYRVSKSKDILVKEPLVKEQRVDGSYNDFNNRLNFNNLYLLKRPLLRCILMAHESGYQVRILSKLNNKKYYTTKTHIDPWFITGFTDAEGSFMVHLVKDKRNLQWRVWLNFVIGLHKSDLALLKDIQTFFGVGNVNVYDKMAFYSVSSQKDIFTIIIPHFDTYPLHTKKKADYILFKCAALIVKTKDHLNLNGIQKIVNIRASINRGLTPILIKAFPNTIPVPRPVIVLEEYTSEWVAGFVSGDGGFCIGTLRKRVQSRIYGLNTSFYISQHVRDQDLMLSFQKFFNCGKLTYNKTAMMFRIEKFNNNYDIIIPFFKKYKIRGIKNLNFIDWVEALEQIKNKEHLTLKGYDKIIVIKNRMNKNRLYPNLIRSQV